MIIGKPLAAFMVVMLFRRPLRSALSISVALAQIGEFSFILAALASSLNILPSEATNALVVASVASITLNPLLYKGIESFAGWKAKAFQRRRSQPPKRRKLMTPRTAWSSLATGQWGER